MTELEYSKEQFFNAHQAVLNAVNEKISLRDLILRCEMQVHAAKMWELEFRTRPDGVVGNRYERDPLIAAMEKIEPITTQFKPWFS